MDVFLAIAALVAVALLATSARLYRIRRTRLMSLLASDGWLALLVGIALGPQMSGLINPEAVLAAAPLLIAALGWIGLMVGLQGRRELLARAPGGIGLTVAADALVTALCAGVVATVGLGLWTEWRRPWPEYVEPVALLVAASIGWAMETRSLSVLASPGSQRVALVIRLIGGFAAMVAIAAFGLVDTLVQRTDDGVIEINVTGAAIGLVVIVALAGLAAILGRFTIGRAGRSTGEQLTVFLGLVAMVAGIAATLGYSPLFAAMVTGAVIANITTGDLLRFERFILRAEQILAFLVFTLAGLLLTVQIGWAELALALALVGARVALKPGLFHWGLGRVVRLEANQTGRAPSFDVGALRFSPIRQSALAIPIALALVLMEPSEFHRRLLTIVALSGVLSALFTVALAAIGARARRVVTAQGAAVA